MILNSISIGGKIKDKLNIKQLLHAACIYLHSFISHGLLLSEKKVTLRVIVVIFEHDSFHLNKISVFDVKVSSRFATSQLIKFSVGDPSDVFAKKNVAHNNNKRFSSKLALAYKLGRTEPPLT